jgi:ferredoxin
VPEISFPGTRYSPVCVPDGVTLALELDASNSPLLFGCRTGICGTCVVEVTGAGALPPSADEREVLEICVPEPGRARLACQVHVTGSLQVRSLS